MSDAYICDYARTPIGKYAGILSSFRTDDLAAIPLETLRTRHQDIDWQCLDDVLLGCANQAGEDNRNVARMSLLLAGFHLSIPGTTINRLCGSGMDALAMAARYIKAGEGHLLLAGGVESMSRAPLVMPKATKAFSRQAETYDTTIGWRFINPKMKLMYGVDAMPETAENVAEKFRISRDSQDDFAFCSQKKYATAATAGFFDEEIVGVNVEISRKESRLVSSDEHPRVSTIENLQRLAAPFRKSHGTVTAGNASGVNDGSAALLLTSQEGLIRHNLKPRARIVASACSGVEPRIMGMGPVPAVHKVLKLAGLTLQEMDVLEINEAFAAQALAVINELKLDVQDSRINPNGGAIALGHPLGMSGARLIGTAVNQLHRIGGRFALCTMCIGVGQGIAMIVERC
ncbi:3-oxoadipyl-CoA thiolase [Prodigiosinella aquatilis]|nr:3-oxoadipyl-CoA thiolase [Prodigiosinella sp. LS101]WJV53971.1 3-oxoadipyl-CoA thiolase [Prodigiosinella sp. LS101]WJV58332.1 3-oxoadipyl-CoA thiolase [Pectobacteriaceae bacterium C111]